MILLCPITKMGSVHIQSCKCFETIADMVEFLCSVTVKWDRFSICPEAYELSTRTGIKRFTDEWHKEYVYPYTLNSRTREKK